MASCDLLLRGMDGKPGAASATGAVHFVGKPGVERQALDGDLIAQWLDQLADETFASTARQYRNGGRARHLTICAARVID